MSGGPMYEKGTSFSLLLAFTGCPDRIMLLYIPAVGINVAESPYEHLA